MGNFFDRILKGGIASSDSPPQFGDILPIYFDCFLEPCGDGCNCANCGADCKCENCTCEKCKK